MSITIGIEIGQKSKPSALCIAETQTREGTHRTAVHFLIRHLERLPVGTSFPDIANRVAELTQSLDGLSGDSPEIFVNATGLGQPVVDLIRGCVPLARAVIPCYFTYGDRRTEAQEGWHSEVQIGKAHLVCRLQTLLQTGCLHLPRLPEAEILAHELREYETRIAPDANDRYGSFPVGTQDDLVNAMGLAVQREARGPGIF